MPSVRVEILREVNGRGILNTYIDDTLSVADEFEEILDIIVARAEARGNVDSLVQTETQEITRGVRPDICERCGAAPAALLALRRQVGMVVVSKTETITGVLCASCGQELRRYVQRQSAVKGWTGVWSAAMNPVVIGTNEKNYAEFVRQLERYR